MAEIVWTSNAESHLIEINNYLSKVSSFYSVRFLKELILCTQVLLKHPLIGKVFYEGAYTYRRLLYKKYIIIYRVDEENIFISAVYHSSKKINEEDFT